MTNRLIFFTQFSKDKIKTFLKTNHLHLNVIRQYFLAVYYIPELHRCGEHGSQDQVFAFVRLYNLIWKKKINEEKNALQITVCCGGNSRPLEHLLLDWIVKKGY